jgi:predicted small lipoprotein YifL
MKQLVLVLLAAGLVFGLAACGKKEPLKPPQGATYPRQYPPP